MEFILVYITHPDEETARRIVAHLLEKRLIACANFFPIESAYLWEGKIERGREYVSLCKTRASNWEPVREEVAAVHPYEVPCIVRLEAAAAEPFARWVEAETRSGSA